MIALMILLAFTAPWITQYDPVDQNLTEALSPPSRQHLFGTDQFGRDILTRVIYGTRISLWVGFVSVSIASLVGVPLGLSAGYFMGWVNIVIDRLTDLLLAFPSVLLAMSIMTILGPNLTNAMIAVGISIAPQYIRLARGSTLSAKEKEYVMAVRAAGGTTFRILVRHILPNILSPLIVLTSLEVGAAVLFASGLSFLGLGARPPTPEWGAMLTEARVYMRQAWWIPVFPGLAITYLILATNLLGDGLRDALDPQVVIQ
jgi:peptide/nickel transport system permease protein